MNDSLSTNAPPAPASEFTECEAVLSYRFQRQELLLAALTHASGADHRLASNERMEFLGDAILGAVVCERLYHSFPDLLEGDLTKLKSVVVSRKTCAAVSHELGLERFLILGKGMTTAPNVPMGVLADVFESLVAAIYLDGGREAVEPFIDRTLGPHIEAAAADESGQNYKSLLQQAAQRDNQTTPAYRIVEEQGPDHEKSFLIEAHVAGRRFAPAWGKSKKSAEQRAAHNALSELRDEPPPHSAETVSIAAQPESDAPETD
ncbi:ribonuclease III [Botrimarina hoheduenensis]|uniref:Ribonuclease 3 n=1 Tax=Botrimarina hoheduenensis TaxID=2528000 RepID=A0A5C5WDC6_9BACT|nr:ribonuclease III [Botrimarina hoheduenensis]TWT48888.1 Ribonuclease 3 [Botrimarina hoheduenensis]